MNGRPAVRTRTDDGAARRSFLCIATLVALSLALYLPSLSADFVQLDDFEYVVQNDLVRRPSLASTWRFISEVRRPSSVEGYYQPLTMISLMLDALWCRQKLSPLPFHATNIVLHAVNAALAFLLGRACGGGRVAAWLAAAVFAIHPAQVESVSWISQRKTVLATALALAAVLSYLRYRRAGGAAWYIGALVAYAAGALAKPTIMPLAVVLFLLDLWPGSEAAALGRRDVARRLIVLAPFLALLGAMGYVAWASQAEFDGGLAVAKLDSFSDWLRWAALLAYNLMLYVGNVVWPLWLSPYRSIPEDLTISNPAIVLAVLVAAATAVVLIVTWRRSRPLFFGITAFIVMLSPAMGPVRFFGSCVADRFLYLPLCLLAVPAAIELERRGQRLRSRPLRAAGVALLVGLAARSVAQQQVWKDSYALWSHAAVMAPRLAKPHVNLCALHLLSGEYAQALRHARTAVELEPRNFHALELLGRCLVRTGDAAAATGPLEQALSLGPASRRSDTLGALAEAHAALGNDKRARELWPSAEQAGAAKRDFFAALGDVALRVAHRYEAAAGYYRDALAAQPEDTQVRWNLGTALAAAGRVDDALREYGQVIEEYRRSGRPTAELEAAAATLRAGSAGPTSRAAVESTRR